MLMYSGLCPNCGGDIDEGRMMLGLPCSNCLTPNDLLGMESLSKHLIRERLLNASRLGKYLSFLDVESELEEFNEFFKGVSGKELWSIQRSWARRMLSNDSFALIAPTGVGKTTLLLIYSLYRAYNGGKVLYVVPTRELMNQVHRLLSNYNRFGIKLFTSDSIKGGDIGGSFVAVVTHTFIHRNKELIGGLKLDLVAVDDFDALLKTSSIVDLILKCIGIGDGSIEHAKKVVSLKNELAFARYSGNDGLVSKLREELYQSTLSLVKSINYGSLGQLLIASATGRSRGERVKVLRELLGFEVGAISDYLRNVVEVYDVFSESLCKDLLSRLVGGTLIFVSKDLGLSYSKQLVSDLRNSGFEAVLATSRKALDMLRSGKANIVVGVSTYYGILTRGLDEPLKIYNVIFMGIPKNEFHLDNLLLNPRTFTYIYSELSRLNVGFKASDELMRKLRNLPPKKFKLLTYSLRGLIEVDGPLLEIKESIVGSSKVVREFVSDYLRSNGKLVLGDYVLKFKGGKVVAWSPDVMTYIQASGRSSRLYNGVMTLGLSIILADDMDLLNIFVRRLRNYVPSFSIKRLDEVDVEEVKRRQVESRSTQLSNSSFLNTNVKSALIVVESPTKARTIASMFGRPGRRYLGEYVVYETVIPVDGKIYVASVAPTFGHLTDLVIDDGLHGVRVDADRLVPVYTSIKRCFDCGYQFTDRVVECPRCGSPRLRDSVKVIDILRKLSQEVDTVFIATDPDDEGEKIAYDVFLAVRHYAGDIRRAEFHEVTRKALVDAIRNSRDIDLLKVNAQVVRRVDDRLVGFEVSNALKKYFNKHWLGGGRVQTPVLSWVVSNYRRYVEGRGYNVLLRLFDKYYLTTFFRSKDEALKYVEVVGRDGIKLRWVGSEVRGLQPKPPFTTDELIAEASNALKLPASVVMKLAQDLFELGLITYHRTDSTHVSGAGIEVAKEFLSRRGLSAAFKARPWGGVGTHECIRPTRPIDVSEVYNYVANDLYTRLSGVHFRLYNLIFNRFISSQMSEALVKYNTYVAEVGDSRRALEFPVEVLEEGFLKVFNNLAVVPFLKCEDAVIRPQDVRVLRGSEVRLLDVSDVIKLMKSKGIGRPSTYAKSIDNNVRHGYLIISKKRLYLIPTKLGMEVHDLLSKNIPEVVSEAMTREVENLLEAVRSNLISRDDALTLLLSDVVSIRLRSASVLEGVEGLGSGDEVLDLASG
ncbi:MAG: reverse gyrase [Sulfolobales archaeon]|nr:reverse gyrase [Sulfolobales archaeon]MDW7969038.1 reverse gyrase [Sulfolobales archaeon]